MPVSCLFFLSFFFFLPSPHLNDTTWKYYRILSNTKAWSFTNKTISHALWRRSSVCIQHTGRNLQRHLWPECFCIWTVRGSFSSQRLQIRNVHKTTRWQTESHRSQKKVKKKTQQTGNKFPEIWLLHLPAKVSKDWGTVGGGRGEAGTTARWSNGRPRTLSPPPHPTPPHFGIEGPWLAGPAGAACGGWDGVWEEVLRCGAPARLPEERRQEALGKTLPSPVCSAPPAGQRAWRCKSGASEQEAEVLE